MEDPTPRSVMHGAITTLCLHPMPVTALTPRRGMCPPWSAVAHAPHRCVAARCLRARPRPVADCNPRGVGATDSERILPPPTVEWRFNRHGGVAMQSAARVVALAFLAALAGCESLSNPPQQTPDPGNRTAAVESVPGQYIVVLQDNVADPATVARDLVSSAGGALRSGLTR